MSLLIRTCGGLLVSWALCGCISVPAEVRADFAPPDGQRPNNFGRLVDTPAGPVVQPDRPTIRAEQPE